MKYLKLALVLWLVGMLAFYNFSNTLQPKFPTSIRVCGLLDQPCRNYAVIRRPLGPEDTPGDAGVTDYDAKTITVYTNKDACYDAKTLVHEVLHAVLFERGFEPADQDSEDRIDLYNLHTWIYHSEGGFTMVLNDNPDFTAYVSTACRERKQ